MDSGLTHFGLLDFYQTHFDLTHFDLTQFDPTNFDLPDFDLGLGPAGWVLPRLGLIGFDPAGLGLAGVDLPNVDEQEGWRPRPDSVAGVDGSIGDVPAAVDRSITDTAVVPWPDLTNDHRTDSAGADLDYSAGAGHFFAGKPAGMPTDSWCGLAVKGKVVSEPAIHIDSVSPRQASKYIKSEFPHLPFINAANFLWYDRFPGRLRSALRDWYHGHVSDSGPNVNCLKCIEATDNAMDNIAAKAPWVTQPGNTGTAIRNYFHTTEWNRFDSWDDAIRYMKKAQLGARAIVYVETADPVAHVFNVINRPEGVVFLDGQTGRLGKLSPEATQIVLVEYSGRKLEHSGADHQLPDEGGLPSVLTGPATPENTPQPGRYDAGTSIPSGLKPAGSYAGSTAHPAVIVAPPEEMPAATRPDTRPQRTRAVQPDTPPSTAVDAPPPGSPARPDTLLLERDSPLPGPGTAPHVSQSPATGEAVVMDAPASAVPWANDRGDQVGVSFSAHPQVAVSPDTTRATAASRSAWPLFSRRGARTGALFSPKPRINPESNGRPLVGRRGKRTGAALPTSIPPSPTEEPLPDKTETAWPLATSGDARVGASFSSPTDLVTRRYARRVPTVAEPLRHDGPELVVEVPEAGLAPAQRRVLAGHARYLAEQADARAERGFASPVVTLHAADTASAAAVEQVLTGGITEHASRVRGVPTTIDDLGLALTITPAPALPSGVVELRVDWELRGPGHQTLDDTGPERRLAEPLEITAAAGWLPKPHPVLDEMSWAHSTAATAEWMTDPDPVTEQEREAARHDAVPVRVSAEDVGPTTATLTPALRISSWRHPIAYDHARYEVRPGKWVQEYTVRLRFQVGPSVDVRRIVDRAQAGLDRLFNDPGYRLPSGDGLHMRVLHDPSPVAHAIITVRPAGGKTDMLRWAEDADELTLAEEVAHFTGPYDEYVRRDEHGDDWVFRGAGSNRVVTDDGLFTEHLKHYLRELREKGRTDLPPPSVKPRHLWLLENRARALGTTVAVPSSSVVTQSSVEDVEPATVPVPEAPTDQPEPDRTRTRDEGDDVVLPEDSERPAELTQLVPPSVGFIGGLQKLPEDAVSRLFRKATAQPNSLWSHNPWWDKAIAGWNAQVYSPGAKLEEHDRAELEGFADELADMLVERAERGLEMLDLRLTYHGDRVTVEHGRRMPREHGVVDTAVRRALRVRGRGDVAARLRFTYLIRRSEDPWRSVEISVHATPDGTEESYYEASALTEFFLETFDVLSESARQRVSRMVQGFVRRLLGDPGSGEVMDVGVVVNPWYANSDRAAKELVREFEKLIRDDVGAVLARFGTAGSPSVEEILRDFFRIRPYRGAHLYSAVLFDVVRFEQTGSSVGPEDDNAGTDDAGPVVPGTGDTAGEGNSGFDGREQDRSGLTQDPVLLGDGGSWDRQRARATALGLEILDVDANGDCFPQSVLVSVPKEVWGPRLDELGYERTVQGLRHALADNFLQRIIDDPGYFAATAGDGDEWAWSSIEENIRTLGNWYHVGGDIAPQLATGVLGVNIVVIGPGGRESTQGAEFHDDWLTCYIIYNGTNHYMATRPLQDTHTAGGPRDSVAPQPASGQAALGDGYFDGGAPDPITGEMDPFGTGDFGGAVSDPNAAPAAETSGPLHHGSPELMDYEPTAPHATGLGGTQVGERHGGAVASQPGGDNVAALSARRADFIAGQLGSESPDTGAVLRELARVQGDAEISGLIDAFRQRSRDLHAELYEALSDAELDHALTKLGLRQDFSVNPAHSAPSLAARPSQEPVELPGVRAFAEQLQRHIEADQFDDAMIMLHGLDRDMRTVWAVQDAYQAASSRGLGDDLVNLRPEHAHAVFDALGLVNGNPVSLEQAARWHEQLKNSTFNHHSSGTVPIRIDYLDGDSEIRAHFWSLQLQRLGAQPSKVFVVRANPGLSVASANAIDALPGSSGTVNWDFHVAPAIVVDTPYRPRNYVLDPVLSDAPLPAEDWLALMGVDIADENGVILLGGSPEHVQGALDQHLADHPDQWLEYETPLGYYPNGKALVIFSDPGVWGRPRPLPVVPGTSSLREADRQIRRGRGEEELISFNEEAERRAEERRIVDTLLAMIDATLSAGFDVFSFGPADLNALSYDPVELDRFFNEAAPDAAVAGGALSIDDILRSSEEEMQTPLNASNTGQVTGPHDVFAENGSGFDVNAFMTDGALSIDSSSGLPGIPAQQARGLGLEIRDVEFGGGWWYGFDDVVPDPNFVGVKWSGVGGFDGVVSVDRTTARQQEESMSDIAPSREHLEPTGWPLVGGSGERAGAAFLVNTPPSFTGGRLPDNAGEAWPLATGGGDRIGAHFPSSSAPSGSRPHADEQLVSGQAGRGEGNFDGGALDLNAVVAGTDGWFDDMPAAVVDPSITDTAVIPDSALGRSGLGEVGVPDVAVTDPNAMSGAGSDTRSDAPDPVLQWIPEGGLGEVDSVAVWGRSEQAGSPQVK
ncbi:protein-glutamine glutaminase family protein [Saccharopolyspora elongata]|uniref:protein-glutamine glutaminase family protein n=1 Tax=Saccharopolyspora elongata TaxID=2530387 RepID=UPI001A9E6AE3|nr:protein-glutamine glutaminase family protein [Saccharopolyspora elongata]